MRGVLTAKRIGNLHSIEFILNLCNAGDRTVELDQRLGKIVRDLDVLEPIERRNGELGSGDV